MKKLLSVVLVVCLCLSAFSSMAFISAETTEKFIDFSKTVRIGADSDLGNGKIVVTNNSDGSMKVDSSNYTKLLFKDGTAITSNLWCKGAVYCLKYNDGTNVVLSKGMQYIINVVYSVDSIDTDNQTYHPQIALTLNTTNNDTAENGNTVLASDIKHNTGDYSLIAKRVSVDGNKPLRLIFAGDGVFTVKSVIISTTAIVTRKADLVNVAPISASGSTYKNFSPATATEPLKISPTRSIDNEMFEGQNQWVNNWHPSALWIKGGLIPLKFEDGTYFTYKAGHQFSVTVNFKFATCDTEDTKKDPKICLVRNNNKSTSGDNGTFVIGGFRLYGYAKNLTEHLNINKSFTTTVKDEAAKDGHPIRLAFSGLGNIEVQSVYITDNNPGQIVTYIDDGVEIAEFANNGDALKTPLAKDGYTFMGWFDANGNKVETVSGNITVTAHWAQENKVDFEKSFRICYDDPSQDKAKLTISYLEDIDGMNIAFEEYYKNYAILNDNEINTGTVWAKGGIIALKYKNDSYVKFASGNRYAINVSYDITRISTQDSYYAPQIGLCYNDSIGNDSSDNGQKMLVANKHTKCGSYTLSAIVNGDTLNNKPLRLIFDGVGECVIKSVTISSILSSTTGYSTVRYIDKLNDIDFAEIAENDSAVADLDRLVGFNFGGWYNGDTKAETVTSDATLTAKWYSRLDLNKDDMSNIIDLICLKKALASAESNLFFDVNRDNKVDAIDVTTIVNNMLGKIVTTINDNSVEDYSIYVSNKSFVAKKAAEEISDAIKIVSGVTLPIVYTETEKEIAIVVDETLEKDNYTVAIDDNNLVVTAGSEYAASEAANKIALFIKTNGIIPAGFTLSGEYDTNYSMVDNYKYAWGDEFDGNDIDSTKWTLANDVKPGPVYATDSAYYQATKSASTWTANGNDMQDGTVTFVNNDYSVNNGVLTMNTRKVADGYTGTKISANQTFRYGIMEAKIKFGNGEGGSYQFWARSKDTSPQEECVVNEFDFAENFGTTDIYANLHTWRQYFNHTNHGSDLEIRDTVQNVTDGEYHYIAMEWTQNIVKFYFDGELYMKQSIADQETWDAFRKSTYLIFGVDVPNERYAIYSNGTTPAEQILANGGNIADLANFSDSISIDYVRVYQLGSDGHSIS